MSGCHLSWQHENLHTHAKANTCTHARKYSCCITTSYTKIWSTLSHSVNILRDIYSVIDFFLLRWRIVEKLCESATVLLFWVKLWVSQSLCVCQNLPCIVSHSCFSHFFHCAVYAHVLHHSYSMQQSVCWVEELCWMAHSGFTLAPVLSHCRQIPHTCCCQLLTAFHTTCNICSHLTKVTCRKISYYLLLKSNLQ